jgi:REP element-mobilizing transposase RayT
MVYLFVHVILSVKGRQALLAKPVRRVLLVHLQKDSGERGIKIVAADGVEDHVHCLLQLMPSQNLAQVVKSIRTMSADWLNDNKLLASAFEWEDSYTAYSVSPSGVQQVIDYIGKQEEIHRSKTLESELELFDKFTGPQGFS